MNSCKQPELSHAPARIYTRTPHTHAHGHTMTLTLTDLAGVAPNDQKNMIGEELYPLVAVHEPELAGKITGMLLELDNMALLNLLESPFALQENIQEALQVLQQHQSLGARPTHEELDATSRFFKPQGVAKTRPGSRRCVALVGSSGGGAATLGHLDPANVVATVQRELHAAQIDLVAVQLVTCKAPLDYAYADAEAALYVLEPETRALQVAVSGTLAEVNAVARYLDWLGDPLGEAPLGRDVGRHWDRYKELVRGSQRWSQLDGLVAISSSPKDVNARAIECMARQSLPVVATGGTSVGQMAASGVQLVGGSGGSVATTPASKAISFAASLAGHWGLPYEPSVCTRRGGRGSSGGGGGVGVGAVMIHSVLDGTLPLALACCLVSWLCKLLTRFLPGVLVRALALDSLSIALSGGALAVGVAAVAGLESCGGLGVLGLLAGSLAGTIANEGGRGGVLAAAVAGSAAGALCPRFVSLAARRGTPATATSVVSAGAAGAVVGYALLLTRMTTVARWLSNLVRAGAAVSTGFAWPWARAVAGAGLGWATFFGSEHGAYHAIILPLIIVESEFGEFSFFGAMDLVCLVAVCAGLCGGTYLAPSTPSDLPLSLRGLRINLWWGDFVEAGYPFMVRDKLVMAAAHVGAACGGALVGLFGLRSSAYLPLPLALVCSNRPLCLALAVMAAALPPAAACYLRGPPRARPKVA